jgi:secreted PhoX family phosphatase
MNRVYLLTAIMICLLAFTPRVFALTFTNDQAAVIAIGEPSLTSFTPSATQTTLVSPMGEAFDKSGNLWVVDESSNRVLEFKAPFSMGEAASIVIGQSSFTGDGYGTTDTTLYAPEAIAFDHSGNLWIVDTSNNRVLEYTQPFSNGEAASIVIGQPNFTSSASNTTATTLNQPDGIAFDSSGDLWVSDALNDRVLEYSAPFSSGEMATLVLGEKNFVTAIDQTSKAGMSTPAGLAFDSTGDLWVADGIRVLEYTTPFTTHEGASIVIGQNTFTNQSTVADATGLDLPYGVAFDPSGNLWVADWGDNRVLEYAAPITIGEAATTVLGQSNLTASAPNAVLYPTASTLNHPWGIAFDAAGDIWITDSAEGRVLGYGSGIAAVASSSLTSSPSSTSTTPTSSTTSTSSSTGSTSESGTTTPSSTSTSTSSSTAISTAGVLAPVLLGTIMLLVLAGRPGRRADRVR